ncbi:hypothetical protein, partial [Tautonia sociabilis]
MPEPFGELLGGPAAFAIILARAGGLVWALAWLVGAGAGMRGRMAAAGLIAVAVAPVVADGLDVPADALELGGRVVVEALSGAALGMAAGLIAAAARLAG